MPEIMAQNPNIPSFNPDNTKVYANVTTTLNIRSGAGTEYEIITAIGANETLTRIGQNEGEWAKVKLDNGIIGYVFASYLKEIEQTAITRN